MSEQNLEAVQQQVHPLQQELKAPQLAKKGSATVSKGKRMLLFLIQWVIIE